MGHNCGYNPIHAMLHYTFIHSAAAPIFSTGGFFWHVQIKHFFFFWNKKKERDRRI